jgi:hypothetical protein
VCDLWFTGPDCGLALCMNNCSGHGACDYAAGECACDAGWAAADCSKRLCPQNCSGGLSYIHTYVRTYIHTCIHIYTYIYVCIYITCIDIRFNYLFTYLIPLKVAVPPQLLQGVSDPWVQRGAGRREMEARYTLTENYFLSTQLKTVHSPSPKLFFHLAAP